jgi:hypothetical protein
LTQKGAQTRHHQHEQRAQPSCAVQKRAPVPNGVRRNGQWGEGR